ncbi:MAG TPA: hypothetical protein ACHBX0_10455 [Arsenophonus sp.]
MSEGKSIIAKITDVLTNASSSVSEVFSTGRDILNMKIDYEVKSKTIDLLNKLGDVPATNTTSKTFDDGKESHH